MKFSKTRKKPDTEALAAETARKAAQDWLPFNDLHDGLLYRTDGTVVGGVSVAPFSLALKATSEKRTIIGVIHAAVNGLDQPWEILSMFRPVDLDTYLSSLDDRAGNTDPGRRLVLTKYMTWVAGIIHGGEAVERKYYLLVSRKGKDAPQEHRANLPQLAQDMQRARGLQVKVMTDQDWQELLFLSFQANHAAVESVPDGLGRIPPIIDYGG
jgi:hypothetical protein